MPQGVTAMGPHEPEEPDWMKRDNIVRKEKWLTAHPGDVIRESQTHRYGLWWEAVRDGRQIVETTDLGRLLDRLESDFQ